MKYAIAMLRDVEKWDGMGRRRRVTRMLSYREAREYTPSNVEMSEIGKDRGHIQHTSQSVSYTHLTLPTN